MISGRALIPCFCAAAAASLEMGRIVPIYESAMQGKLASRWFRRIVRGVLEQFPVHDHGRMPEAIPAAIRARLQQRSPLIIVERVLLRWRLLVLL